jgi:HlyD family secretion protein
MTSTQSIFRKAAMDRLSSPEQLDELMQVTTPKSWLALAAFGALLTTALIWGIFGRIADQVHGKGILLRSGGIFVVATRGEGNVLEVLVRPGQVVTNGELLARVSQPELEIRLRQARTNRDAVAAGLQDLVRNQLREQKLEDEDVVAQRLMLARMVTNYSAQIASLEARTNIQFQLLGKGLVSQAQYLDSQSSLYSAQHELYRTQVQLQQLDITSFQAGVRRRQTRSDREEQLQQAQHQLEYLSNLFTLNSEVHSPCRGEILEVMVNRGDLISASTPVLSLQGTTNELIARLFLSSADGKRLSSSVQRSRGRFAYRSDTARTASGQSEALVAPVSVRKEEFGLMRGTVVEVSEYPVTPQGMLRILQNPTLVAEFTQAGAPIEVTVRLFRTNSESSYVWTSGKGPPTKITSGTLCDATITIARRAPISLVLPILSKTVRN